MVGLKILMSTRPQTPQWFVLRGSSREGPFDSESLRKNLVEGALTGLELAWTEGMPAWQSISTIPLFSSVKKKGGTRTDLIWTMPIKTEASVPPSEKKKFALPRLKLGFRVAPALALLATALLVVGIFATFELYLTLPAPIQQAVQVAWYQNHPILRDYLDPASETDEFPPQFIPELRRLLLPLSETGKAPEIQIFPVAVARKRPMIWIATNLPTESRLDLLVTNEGYREARQFSFISPLGNAVVLGEVTVGEYTISVCNQTKSVCREKQLFLGGFKTAAFKESLNKQTAGNSSVAVNDRATLQAILGALKRAFDAPRTARTSVTLKDAFFPSYERAKKLAAPLLSRPSISPSEHALAVRALLDNLEQARTLIDQATRGNLDSAQLLKDFAPVEKSFLEAGRLLLRDAAEL